MPATYTSRLEGLTTSVAVKAPCRVATTAAITLSGLQTIDGIALAARDRVLVKDQVDATQNGIWLAQTGAWTRSLDFDGTLDAVDGTILFIVAGSVNADRSYKVRGTAGGPITIGSGETEFDIAYSYLTDAADTAVAAAADAEAALADALAAAAAASTDRAAAESAATTAAVYAARNERVSKLTDTSITSTTTLASDPDLVVALGANSLTVLRGHINYSTGATGDFKWRHSGPAAPASLTVDRQARAPGDTAWSGIAGDTAYSVADITVLGGAGTGLVEFVATIQSPTAGNFVFSWAQNTSDGTATVVKAGSAIDVIRLPSTANFAFANTAIAKLGDYSGPASAGGHNVITFYQPSGISNSYAETIATGTAADAQLFAGTYTITVDGVASTVTAPAGWTYVNLFTGLSDTDHRVRIKGTVIDSDIAIRVSGIAPNVTRPTDIPPYFRIYDPTYAAYISKDGALDIFTGLYGGSVGTAYTATGCGEGHRFRADTTSIVAWLYCAAPVSPVELLRDGVSLGVVTPSVVGTMERVVLATGLATGAHEYEIRPIYSGDSFYCFAIMVDTLATTAHANKSVYAWYGDSNTEMQVGEDARTHASFLLAKRRGWANVRRGVGGQSISTWGRDNTALVTSSLSQAADVIINMLGVNDYYFSNVIATVQADCTTMLANQRAGNAGAPIVVLGIHDHYRAQADSTPYSNANRVLYNARLQAAVAARVTAGDANVFYIDTTGWISVSPGVNLRDSVHLNAAGWVAFEAALNTALVGIGL